MKKLILLATISLIPHPAFAQKAQTEHSNHEQMMGQQERSHFPSDYNNVNPEVPKNKAIQKYAYSDDPNSGQKNFGVQLVHDNMVFYQILGNRLEQRIQKGDDVALFDFQGWIGTDYDKLWVKSEGEYNTSQSDLETTSLDVLYSRNISPFWDVQAGYRHDFIPDNDDRNFAALGLQGLAPYWFEIDATAYLSDEGKASAVIEAEYELLLTQKLVLQPRFETEIAVQDVEEYNIGSGITGFETGLRLRYEFSRKFAPYVGISWEQNVGETKNLIQNDGGDTSNTAFVTGIRFWF